jgi:hypothetical protein
MYLEDTYSIEKEKKEFLMIKKYQLPPVSTNGFWLPCTKCGVGQKDGNNLQNFGATAGFQAP